MIKKGIHSGFTLIELMVVTVLIGLIVLISIPVVNSVNNKFIRATRQVSGVLKQAREFAVTKADTVLISFNETGKKGHYEVYLLSGGTTSSMGISGDVPSDVTMNGGNYTQMVFLPIGSLDTTTTSAESVLIQQGDQKLSVKVIAATGLTRIIKY